MMAVHLPDIIPQAGAPLGPPLPSQFHNFFGAPIDVRSIFSGIVQDPETLPGVYSQLEQKFKQQAAAQKH